MIYIIIIILMTLLSGCTAPSETAAYNAAKTEEASGWTVTQYGDAGGNQLMFYTIEDKDNNLIIIDGGYDTDEAKVRNVIENHGNHVSVWIITHPHPDHAGAFNAIMSNPGDIRVDDIYTIEVNYDRYLETAEDYDRFDVYETFLDLTKDLSSLHYVYENDEFDILGLRMKVLHTWDGNTDELDENLSNNGSMMFKLSGEEESMLFCADVESETQLFVIDRHSEELDVDYVQLGHHGNWGLTAEFYEYTSPKAVFFDAPDWLVYTTDATYDAFILKDYFDKKGIKTYAFTTAPNTIILH